MTDNQISVQRQINASTDVVFSVLSNPARHVEIDGSGFVKGDDGSNRIPATVDVCTMNMEGPHMGGEYQTDNHVTGYHKNALLAWKTAPAGTDPPGCQWVWELESQGSEATNVTLTYDWDKVEDPELLKKISFPLVSQSQLQDSLERLDQVVTGG